VRRLNWRSKQMHVFCIECFKRDRETVVDFFCLSFPSLFCFSITSHVVRLMMAVNESRNELCVCVCVKKLLIIPSYLYNILIVLTSLRLLVKALYKMATKTYDIVKILFIPFTWSCSGQYSQKLFFNSFPNPIYRPSCVVTAKLTWQFG